MMLIMKLFWTKKIHTLYHFLGHFYAFWDHFEQILISLSIKQFLWFFEASAQVFLTGALASKIQKNYFNPQIYQNWLKMV